MKRLTSSMGLVIMVMMVVGETTAHAVTLQVNCGGSRGLTSIGSALNLLKRVVNRGPNTINVSGTCSENVALYDLSHLTITSTTGASVTDPTGGAKPVFDIQRSQDVSVSGLSIWAPLLSSSGITAGNGDAAVSCTLASSCFLSNNSITSGTGDGVFVARSSSADISGGIISDNAGRGIAANLGSRAGVTGVTMNNNGNLTSSAQIRLYNHSSLQLRSSTITNNTAYYGIRLTDNSSADIQDDVISGNQSGGVSIEGGSEVSFYPSGSGTSITGNTGGGVLVWDVSLAHFWGPVETGTSITDKVSGNGGMDINCETGHAFAIGMVPTSGTTNCIAP